MPDAPRDPHHPLPSAPRAADHPLPSDPRARHDELPESIDDARDVDDAPAAERAPPGIVPPDGQYRDPDGRSYPV